MLRGDDGTHGPEAKRLSGQAGRRLANDAALNPGIGAVFGKTGRTLSVSNDLARFGAYPSMGGYSAEKYENDMKPRAKVGARPPKAKPKPKKP